MKFFQKLGVFKQKNQAAQGFGQKKVSHQTFILEPLITPSGLVDSVDHAPHPLAVDLHTTALPDVHLPTDTTHTVDTHPVDIHTTESIPHTVEVTHAPTPDALNLHTTDHSQIIAAHTVEIPVADHQLEALPFLHSTSTVDSHASPAFNGGVFTVGTKGEVSFDYLFDGGYYQGQIAIFNMEGMDKFVPGSAEFIHEAASRALSDSHLGHVVISDATEGARFGGVMPGEPDYNAGQYSGVKSFAMDKGSTFGIMLVPNGTVHQVFDGNTSGDLRPLFSMTTANPNEAFHVGQIADVNGKGNTFVMEDMRVDAGSDHDYNDMIFQIHGATGKAVHLDDVIDHSHDWRQTELGGKLMEFIKPPANQPLIGVIDTGVAAHNPDINPYHIHFGPHSDYVAGDGNPLLQANEGSEHGTHVTGIIAATQDNGIGIDGINDQAPIYEARATGSGHWAQALTDFVDTAKESGQPHAIANLSLDLTQVNPDGSVTTRYEFTPVERSALEYARQNGVLIVAASGNDGGVMSALGQASQEFDNIITVGAAKHLAIPTPAAFSEIPITTQAPLHIDSPTNISHGISINNSLVTPDHAFDRADYSSYGDGLDIVADGGTIDNQVLSTVGDSTGTMAGTSVATAQVTGAASLVWAENPGLNYRQVIEILESTATDLNAPGWDMETGAGLLDIAAAVGLAKVTTPEVYATPPISGLTSWSGEGRVKPMERAASDQGPDSNYYDWESYTIQRGDTLSAIALRTMGSASAPYYNFIAQKNGIADPSLIYPGQQISIPKKVSAPTPTPTPTPPPQQGFDINKILDVVPSSMRSYAQNSIPLILAECKADGVTDIGQIAYILATAEHESHLGQWMEELASGAEYEKRPDLGSTQPGDGVRFKGRGYVQITGRSNYTDWSRRLGIDLVSQPTKAADPAIAVKILVQGMRDGTFTSKKLSNYINGSSRDFYNARRIVNGTQEAGSIAQRAQVYFDLLSKNGAPVQQPAPSTRREYIVRSGDTLSAIAKRELGDANRWREIQKADGSTFTEDEARRLQVGQKVYLPVTYQAGTGKPVTPSNPGNGNNPTPQPTPPSTSGRYNTQASLAYAKQYAFSRNPKYKYYDDANCANFVSQCLIAGGLIPDETDGPSKYINADGLSKYLVNKGYAKQVNSINDLKPGDVIAYSVDGKAGHIVIYLGDGKIAGNTQNTYGGGYTPYFIYNKNGVLTKATPMFYRIG